MKAEDTVMKPELRGVFRLKCHRAVADYLGKDIPDIRLSDMDRKAIQICQDVALEELEAQAEITWKAREPEIAELRIEVGSIAFKKGKKAGQEDEKAYWIKEIESQVHNAYEGGKEEERKKWIKEAMKAGILISKPEELAGIAEEFKLQGRREVVDFAEETCPLIKDMIRWRAYKKEWGLK